ncbi:ATP-binding protein [Anaerovorax odorimutans]|uniref:ATP-binding protein n=1 Tax=Anaerovorax odorimutans TaxID=109327 RepID=UPI000412C5FF|nr:ATP-binding protein [Anaerovorax odorimutans]
MSDILKLSVPGKPEYVGMVRLAISSLANHAGFDIEAIEDIKVAVSEACTNVVCHGQVGFCSSYEVDCEIGNNKLIISIIDQAGGYDINNYKEPNIDCPKQGGLGVFIIKALMDEVIICSDIGTGTSIKMVKYCK